MEPIAAVVVHYYPDFEPPADRGRWNACRCPAHDEERASASISYELGAIRCHACGFKGDVISIIRQREEGITFDEAVKRAEEIVGGSYEPVSRKPARKPGRRVFGGSGAVGSGRRTFPSGLRG